MSNAVERSEEYRSHISYNAGTETDLSIKELVLTIQHIVKHKGEIQWDSTKPDRTPRKLLDVSKLHQEG
jgi:GDP-L-fucose synthase